MNQEQFVMVGMAAKALDDIEGARIRTGQRYDILTKSRDELDEDGFSRGHGVPEDAKAAVMLKNLHDSYLEVERGAVKYLEYTVKQTVFADFIKDTKGLGMKTAGRLLACTHDPYWHYGEDRPRTVSELWAYCGMSVVNGSSQRRKKGVVSNWNDDARKRLYVITDGFIKQGAGGPYRELYDEYKARYSPVEVDGKELFSRGEEDFPISKGHVDNRARRVMSKELLKRMWIVSRDAR